MESANLHHRQQQQKHQQLQDHQLVGSSNSNSNSIIATAPSSSYGVGDSHAWTPNIMLNSSNFSHNASVAAISNSRPLNSSMIQDFNFNQWTSCSSRSNYQVGKIKEELPSNSLPKFTEMLNSAAPTMGEDFSLSSTNYIKNEHKDTNDNLSEKLMLKTLTSSYHISPHHFSPPEGYNSYDSHTFSSNLQHGSRGNFSQIYPSINISNLSHSSSAISSNSLDMKALDLLSTARFSRGLCQPSVDSLCILNESSMPYGLDHTQHATSRLSCSPNRISPTNNRIEETKRNSSVVEPKAAQSATKKSRAESRTSCPTIKVRKEKLGDRIAALQQLVAPFGKTDTASVLMEAIGYIKFLTSQVETLSVPYMKSSRNKMARTMHGGSKEKDGNGEPKFDLRSRGLCLVPLSCMSYVAASEAGGGGIWPPSNFGGGFQ